MLQEVPLKLTDREITAVFTEPDMAQRFPPVLTLDQASDLLQVPVGTLRDWRSRGLLGCCCRKVGRHVRFYRDRLLKLAFNEGIEND